MQKSKKIDVVAPQRIIDVFVLCSSKACVTTNVVVNSPGGKATRTVCLEEEGGGWVGVLGSVHRGGISE